MSLHVAADRGRYNEFYENAQARLSLMPNYHRWISAFFRSVVHGKVLELGCGAGHVIREYLPRVSEVIAVDHNPALLGQLSVRYPADTVRPVSVDLRGEWNELADMNADFVVALDVMEHFENDREFVRKLRTTLAPTGSAIIKVPAQPHLYGDADVASGHYLRYSPERLSSLMEDAGFRVVKQRYMNAIGALAYRFNRGKKKNFSKSVSPVALRVANLLVPLIAACDRIPGLMGLSLIGRYQLRQAA